MWCGFKFFEGRAIYHKLLNYASTSDVAFLFRPMKCKNGDQPCKKLLFIKSALTKNHPRYILRAYTALINFTQRRKKSYHER